MWKEPPFLIIETFLGTPIFAPLVKINASLSTIAIDGAAVYPLPLFLTLISKISPFLEITLNVASLPSPSVITTFGFE